MTAPDVNADVRARFEACFAESGWIGDGMKTVAWHFYRAAHAALSGEVRELVETASEFHAVVCDGKDHGGDAFHLTCPICEAGALLESALAKFRPTHQEKP